MRIPLPLHNKCPQDGSCDIGYILLVDAIAAKVQRSLEEQGICLWCKEGPCPYHEQGGEG